MEDALRIALLVLLIVCAVSVSFTKKLLTAVIIFSSYSLIMAILWAILESPDLAVTEAAVGAGITGILFYVTLKRINAADAENASAEKENGTEKNEKKE